MDSKGVKLTRVEDLLSEIGTSQTQLESLTKIPTMKGVQLLPHQLRTIYWLYKLKRTLCAEKMGLGKTLSALCAFLLARSRGEAKKALFAVKSVKAVASIIADTKKFTDLQTGTLSTKAGARYDDMDVVVTTYASLLRVCTHKQKVKAEGITWLQKQFDVFIWDEIQAAKNPSSLTALSLYNLASPDKNPKAMVFGMTGTLYGKRVQDAWTPFYIVDGGTTLGGSYEAFLAQYCRPVKFSVYTPYGVVQKIRYETDTTKVPYLVEKITKGCIIYDTQEVTELPPFKFHISWYSLTGDAKRTYSSLRDVHNIQKAQQVRPGVHRTQFMQIASGFLYVDDEMAGSREIAFFKNKDKFKSLYEDIEMILYDDPTDICLVFYVFTGSGQLLEQELTKKKVEFVHLVPGQSTTATISNLERINSHEGGLVVLASALSAGESLNLQRAHTVLYYDPPDGKDITFAQSLGRIRRLGSTAEHLNVFLYAGEGTPEPGILYKLAKGRHIAESVYDIDSFSDEGSKVSPKDLSPTDFEVSLFSGVSKVQPLKEVKGVVDTVGRKQALLDRLKQVSKRGVCNNA